MRMRLLALGAIALAAPPGCATSAASKSAAAEPAQQPEDFSQDLCLQCHRDGLPPVSEEEIE